MRTVLLGSDFVYNSNGDLIPIELNTNIGEDFNTIESADQIYDLKGLSSFITEHHFRKVIYIGFLRSFRKLLSNLCSGLGVEFERYNVFGSTVPYIEDFDDILIIRSAFDGTAIIDDVYCKNKVNFLTLIKNQPFGSQFAYMDENGDIINHISTIKDNGNNPNFILKSVYPKYDREIYPKMFKVTTQSELDIVLKNVNFEHFLMEFHFNPNKLYHNNIQVVRTYNMLFPPELKSLTIGQCTRLTSRNIDELSTYHPQTFELESSERRKYLIYQSALTKPKLLDTDLVEMADGTFKKAIDLQVNDVVKTIDIANPNNTDISDPCNDFLVNYDTFLHGTVYSTNKILDKARVNTLVDYVIITFTDGTTWEDTETSSYLMLRDDNVRFCKLELVDDNAPPNDCRLKIGDQMILINSQDNVLTTVLKEIASIEKKKVVLGGWEITVENQHLFLTKAEDSDSSYVSIEHNVACAKSCCTPPCAMCTNPNVCCPTTHTCLILIKCAACGKV